MTCRLACSQRCDGRVIDEVLLFGILDMALWTSQLVCKVLDVFGTPLTLNLLILLQNRLKLLLYDVFFWLFWLSGCLRASPLLKHAAWSLDLSLLLLNLRSLWCKRSLSCLNRGCLWPFALRRSLSWHASKGKKAIWFLGNCSKHHHLYIIK